MSNTVSERSASIGHLLGFPLLKALIERRSRRFGKGMHLDGGPLTFQSRQSPQPLAPEQEAALAFAACGTTGYALADLPYESGSEPESGSGNMMAQFFGRTVASADALHLVSLFVFNDEGTWLVRRPQEFVQTEIPELVQLAREHKLVEWYEKSRVRLSDKRLDIPRQVPYLPAFNKWSANLPGTSYFLPVNEISALYINFLLAAFNEEHAYFIVDDRNDFQPAGIAKFARSKGGHLHDDPARGRFGSLSFFETWLCEFAAIEQGGILQNLGLMSAALGLGGFPHFAAHPYIWFETLGFRMQNIAFSRAIGAGAGMRLLLKLLKKDITLPTAVGLEHEGDVLLKPYCPPYYPNMEEAVVAFVDKKFAPGKGIFRDGGVTTAWRDGKKVQDEIPEYSDKTIAATIAYCEYVHRRYGRFPTNNGPFRTILAYQAHSLDKDFYQKYYRPEAVGDIQ